MSQRRATALAADPDHREPRDPLVELAARLIGHDVGVELLGHGAEDGDVRSVVHIHGDGVALDLHLDVSFDPRDRMVLRDAAVCPRSLEHLRLAGLVPSYPDPGHGHDDETSPHSDPCVFAAALAASHFMTIRNTLRAQAATG